jgi:hypothetical protein
MPVRPREPQQSERDGDDSHVDADQREGEEMPPIRTRRLDGDSDLVLERRPRRRHQLDEVRLPLDPRIRDRNGGASEMPQRLAVLRGERPIRVVYRDLRDGDRVGAVVEDGEIDASRRQCRPLDDQTLDRRHAFRSDNARRAGANEQHDEPGEQHDRQECREPQQSRLRLQGRICGCGRGRCGSGVRYHGAPPPLRTCPSSRARRTRSGARGT